MFVARTNFAIKNQVLKEWDYERVFFRDVTQQISYDFLLYAEARMKK
jgi:hypothetical protein